MALFSGRIGVSRRNFIANHLPWNCKGEGGEQERKEVEAVESSTRWCNCSTMNLVFRNVLAVVPIVL